MTKNEVKIERIAKNIVGMGFQTSTVSYDENKDVRPSVTTFIKEIRDYVANLSFNGSKITLKNQFRCDIPRFNVIYTPNVKNRSTKVINKTSQTTTVLIVLSAIVEYDVDGSLVLENNILSAPNNYKGTLYAEIKPKIQLQRRALFATTPDPICNVELIDGMPNNVTLDDKDNLIESWLAEIERVIKRKFTNNAHTEHYE